MFSSTKAVPEYQSLAPKPFPTRSLGFGHIVSLAMPRATHLCRQPFAGKPQQPGDLSIQDRAIRFINPTWVRMVIMQEPEKVDDTDDDDDGDDDGDEEEEKEEEKAFPTTSAVDGVNGVVRCRFAEVGGPCGVGIALVQYIFFC